LAHATGGPVYWDQEEKPPANLVCGRPKLFLVLSFSR